jgi:hypothetical protein
MKPTIIRPDGTETEVQPINGKDFKLAELNSIVEGYIEIVPIGKHILDGKQKPSHWIMILNEEGKLQNLPVNERASILFEEANHTTDIIVGTVLICPQNMVK